jgi:phage terminase large subunit
MPFDNTPLHKAVADIIGYGGAAGGGKTDTLLAIATLAATNYPGLNIGYFRREFPQLEGPGGAILRSREFLGHFAKYNEQKKRWTIPTGKKDQTGKPLFSLLQFCHCADSSDVYNYQSIQFDIILVDEVTQFEKDMIKYLLTRNRATVSYPTFTPFSAFGTNPGNVGHQYFKDEFVTLGEPEKVNIYINESGDEERHLFIPSKLTDNHILVARDPGYARRVGSTELNRKILLEGDWDVFSGQAFSELSRDKHIVDDFTFEGVWRFFGAYDQGFNHPFSFGIFAVDRDSNVYLVARATNRLKRVDEIARIMEETAQRVLGQDGLKKLSYIIGGWDCWNRQRDGGPTIAEQFQKSPQHILLTRARENRVQAVNQIRKFIAWKGSESKDGKLVDGEPKFFIFKSCAQVYDVLARMIFDTQGPYPEDVLKVDADENGQGGDDDYDLVRYGLMSRPRPGEAPKQPVVKNTVLWHIKKKQEQRWLREEYT